MLDELHAVDWTRAHHAYGSARKVPDWIIALTSTDPRNRRNGMDGGTVARRAYLVGRELAEEPHQSPNWPFMG